MANVSCPHCKGLIAADPGLAGQQVACPHCKRRLLMPTAPVLPRVQPVAEESPSVASEPFDFLQSLPATSGTPTHSPRRGSSYTAHNTKKANPLLWVAIGVPTALIGLCVIGVIVAESSKTPKGTKHRGENGLTGWRTPVRGYRNPVTCTVATRSIGVRTVQLRWRTPV